MRHVRFSRPAPRLVVPLVAALAALSSLIAPLAAVAQQRLPTPPESAPPAPPYANYADLVVTAPVIIDARIRSATRIKGPEAAAVPAGRARFYVEADLLALIRSATPLPPRIAYLLDLPVDARGRAPRVAKLRVLLFARPVTGRTGVLQLIRPDAQRGWTPGGDLLTRRITREALAPGAAPQVTGVGNAFHTAGALPGEGETQVFLTTAGNRPVSLSIVRRPSVAPRWSVALDEIVDAALPPPQRDTLLWYRLACALPPELPEASLAGLEPGDAQIAREDYRLVMRELGSCDRTTRL